MHVGMSLSRLAEQVYPRSIQKPYRSLDREVSFLRSPLQRSAHSLSHLAVFTLTSPGSPAKLDT